MAGVKGKSGRHTSAITREGYYFRLRPEVINRVERCTPLLELKKAVRMSKAEALEHLLTMACEVLERAREGREAPASISEISEISNGISALHELAKSLHLIDEDIPFDEDLAPASSVNGQGAPVPLPPMQPAIPLALEPAPTTAHPVDVLQVSETPTATRPTPQPERREPAVKTMPALSEDIVKIAEARTQYDRLSERAFIQLLFDRGIYRHRAKDGREVPIPHTTLREWLQRAREAGLL